MINNNKKTFLKEKGPSRPMPVCERPSSTWWETCCRALACSSVPSLSFSRLVPKKSCKRKKNTSHSGVWRLNFFAFFSCCLARIQDGRSHLHLPLLLICPVHHIHHHEGHYYRPDGRWGDRFPAAGHIWHVAFIMVFKMTPSLFIVSTQAHRRGWNTARCVKVCWQWRGWRMSTTFTSGRSPWTRPCCLHM